MGIILSFFPSYQLSPVLSTALLNPQQPVVLGHPLCPAGSAGFDLPRVDSHRQIRDEGVLGLPRAVGDNGPIPAALGQLYAVQGLRQGADLAGLDENGVSRPLV